MRRADKEHAIRQYCFIGIISIPEVVKTSRSLDLCFMNSFLYRLIPVLVNGMKYSDIDIILLKVRKLFPDE